jgi:hypothetical protein
LQKHCGRVWGGAEWGKTSRVESSRVDERKGIIRRGARARARARARRGAKVQGRRHRRRSTTATSKTSGNSCTYRCELPHVRGEAARGRRGRGAGNRRGEQCRVRSVRARARERRGGWRRGRSITSQGAFDRPTPSARSSSRIRAATPISAQLHHNWADWVQRGRATLGRSLTPVVVAG